MRYFSAALCLLVGLSAGALEIWEGPDVTFTKAAFADSTLPANQDQLTAGVILTRADTNGLFNIALEGGYVTNVSPSDTEWAFQSLNGNPATNVTASNFDNLVFADWRTSLGGATQLTGNILNRPGVIHLITEDIYLNVEFTVWGQGMPPGGSAGGAFTYIRSTPTVVAGSPPVVNAIGNQNVDENATLVVNVSATDDDGDNVTFSSPNLPTFCSIADTGSLTGEITCSPGFADAGNYPNIEVIATDDSADTLTGNTFFTLDVNDVTVAVPDVVGLAQATAEANIVAAGLVVGTVTSDFSDTVPAGDVISQNPTAGTNVDPGSAVDLVVSLGPQTVAVPDVVGLAQATAEANIVSAGLVVGTVTTDFSDTVPAGDVISQNPTGGTNVALGTAVDLVVSLGQQTVAVPDVVGLAQATAEANIVAAGLIVGTVTTDFSDTVPAGDVISQNPTGGTNVALGTAVDLVVSLGQQTVAVPDVVGLAQATAEANIVAAGLAVGTVTTDFSDTVPAGDVISQNPTGSTNVALGTAVDLVVSLGQQTVAVPDVVGLAQATAEANIVAAGLVVGTVTTDFSDTVPAGDVISQNPTGGTNVVLGTAVDLVVSLGQQTVAVPDVVGLAQATAEANIVAAGLVVGTVTTDFSDTVPAGDVISQNPTGGTNVVLGTAVDLVVSLGQQTVAVPDVVGLAQATAEANIVAAGLVVGTVTTDFSDTVPAGDVISQNPTGGTNVALGTAVDLVVSLGQQTVAVPDVVGLAQATAEANIVAAGLVVGTVTTDFSDTVPAGDVISQNPTGGTNVALGTAVDLVVSLGPQTVAVPDVVGLAQATAEGNIVAAGLTVGTITNEFSDTVPAGDVVSQNPTGGTNVALGTAVDLVVSLGQQTVAVPDVVGLAQATAEANIVAAGLIVGTVTTDFSDTVPAGDVISQNPTGGTNVALGTAVDLVVSLGQQTVAVPDVVGLAQATAEANIVAAGLIVGTVTTDFSDTVPAGDVISQNPTGGTNVVLGTAVDLVVSLGQQTVAVPDVVGLAQATAEANIVAAGLVVGTVTTDFSDTVPAGDVISQNPTGGTNVVLGTAVDLVVSLGQQTVAVPDVVGLAQATAEANIVAAGLTVGTITNEFSDTVPAGDVVSQNPTGGTNVALGTAVDLVVSLGQQTVPVPDVVGLAQATAEANIVAAGLVVGTVTTDFSDTVPAGDVISQNPTGGTNVALGTAVDLVVSLGQQTVAVPDVVGLAQATAEANIVAAGLVVGTVTTDFSDTVPAGDVISQNPTGGTNVALGTAVDLVVSLGQQTVVVPDVVGLAQATAEANIVAAGLIVGTVTTDFSDTVPAGDVISQNPTGGTNVALGTAVDLVVSLGQQTVVVPDVVGLAQATAEANIVAAGLIVGTVTTDFSDTVPAGDVISQNPTGGTNVVLGTAVDLVVSEGPAPGNPPVVDPIADQTVDEGVVLIVDLSATDADGDNVTFSSPNLPGFCALIDTGNLTGDITCTPGFADAGNYPGIQVTATDDSASALSGSTLFALDVIDVTIVVSDVVGLVQATAEANIVADGLVVGTVTTTFSDTVPAGSVVSQNPTAGTNVDPGSAVDLVVSLGQQTVAVPDVVGLAQATAEADIVAAGLVLGTVTTEFSDTVPAGDVISQNPAAGTDVALGSAVDLVVSLGQQTVAVPDVVGLAQAAAEADIVAAGLVLGTVTTEFSDTVPAGDVISQNPAAGTDVALGSAVDLVVSLGQQTVAVPDVVGLAQATAEADIVAAGLVLGTVTTEFSDTVPAGDVISQNPAAGTDVALGSAVDLVVSLGQQTVAVPDVVGLAQATAEANIVAAGLVVGAVTTEFSDTVAAGDVISQDPAAGTDVAIGSSIDLVVSLGQAAGNAPVLAAIGDQVVDTGNTLSITISATDDDGDNVSFSSPNLPVFCSIADTGALTGQIDCAPSTNDDGVFAGIQVVATDDSSQALTGSTSFTLTVNAVTVPVPDVVGLSQTDAEAAIASAGLTVGTVSNESSDTVPAGNVISQDPADGTQVAPGSDVNLVVSVGLNGAPTIQTIDDQTVNENKTISVPIWATDPNGDSVSFNVDGPFS